MSFIHRMPFGAELQNDGAVRFRLWAPAERAISVILEGAGEKLPLTATKDGWFELVTRHAAAGDRYRFELVDGQRVPDPASRFQAGDVHGNSVVVDPTSFRWRHPAWHGRPWHEAVIAEVHVGTFSPEGTFIGALSRLKPLADLGITALELMPIADFPGSRNWGYDGVLPFAPDERYGTPDDLKELIDGAHEHGLMILLDVVYNHFGPEGNYLHRYAPQTFTDRRQTPWGHAIDYSQRAVRDLFIHNARTGSRSIASTDCASMRCTRSWTTRSRISSRSWPNESAQRRPPTATSTSCWRTTATPPHCWRAMARVSRPTIPHSGTMIFTIACMSC
jgi:maltooligosyltrehalose trehalohydrolase